MFSNFNFRNNDYMKSQNKKKDIRCINCGKKGHIYKKCHYPIMSFGLICINFNDININKLLSLANKLSNNIINPEEINFLYNKLKNIDDEYLDNNLKYLLIKRRNSISIIEFMRGKYKFEDIDYLNNTFLLMTNKEKYEILNKDFNDIWNNLWNINSTTSSFQNEYLDSKKKFELLKDGITTNVYNIPIKIDLRELVKRSGNKYNDTEWGFPKGRRNLNESDINCAKREFNEETDFNKKDYEVININPFTELFMGINKVRYKQKYYIAQCISNKIPTLNKSNNIQNIEIGDIGWFTFKEGLSKIRDYNLEKRNLFCNLNFILKKIILNMKNELEKII